MNEGARRFRPDAVFVGAVSKILDVSPWCMPLPLATFSENACFTCARQDLRSLLWPLRNKVLVCDCSSSSLQCWALFLKAIFCDMFKVDPNDQYMPMTDVTSNIDNEFNDSPLEDFGFQGVPHLARQLDLAASGRQAPRHRPAQLVTDGLTCEEHLAASMLVKHPFLSETASTFAVNLALEGERWPAERLVTWRGKVCKALEELALTTASEDRSFLDLVAPNVSAVLKAYSYKNIAFMREVCFLCAPRDYAAISCLTVGLPMIGWTFPAFGLLERVKPPEVMYEVWKEKRQCRNEKVLSRIHKSDDAKLDAEAYLKTLEEAKSGVLLGPFYSLDGLPVASPSLAPRNGIWECHGDAEEASVRNIVTSFSASKPLQLVLRIPIGQQMWMPWLPSVGQFRKYVDQQSWKVGSATPPRRTSRCLEILPKSRTLCWRSTTPSWIAWHSSLP